MTTIARTSRKAKIPPTKLPAQWPVLLARLEALSAAYAKAAERTPFGAFEAIHATLYMLHRTAASFGTAKAHGLTTFLSWNPSTKTPTKGGHFDFSVLAHRADFFTPEERQEINAAELVAIDRVLERKGVPPSELRDYMRLRDQPNGEQQ